MIERSDEDYMREALKEADKALKAGEVPVGAVIVARGHIIARGHNYTERLNDVTAHAEMQAFTAASDHLGAKFLNDCALYVTLEPCVMCAGAAYWTRIGKLVYGASDPKRGYTLANTHLLHAKTTVISGILEEECGRLLKTFFAAKRQ